MTHFMQSDDFDRDPALTLQLRAFQRPPADPAYWDGLEARIMDRIVADSAPRTVSTPTSLAAISGWWEPYSRWSRVGGLVAAAALALTVFGLWNTRTEDDDARLAYEAAVEALSTPLDSMGRPLSDTPREKTVPDLFRY